MTVPTPHLARIPASQRRAFTLLELILAIAILASITTIIAAMWSQSRAWSDDNASHLKSMRQARVLEFIRQQWSDRRSGAAIDDQGGKVRIKPTRFEFVTATPLLHPHWPLVSVAYIIERDYTPGLPPGIWWRLKYEEARVSAFTSATEVDARHSSGAANPATADEKPLATVLLDGLSEVHLERFGVAAHKNGSIEPPADRDEKPEWRELEEEFGGDIPGFRLVGKHENKEFTCVLFVGASR